MRWGFVEHDALFFFWGTWLLPCWHADTVTCWSYWRISWIAGKCDPITDFSCNFCWAGKRHHRCFPSFKMLPGVKASPPWASFSMKHSSWNCRQSQWLETLQKPTAGNYGATFVPTGWYWNFLKRCAASSCCTCFKHFRVPLWIVSSSYQRYETISCVKEPIQSLLWLIFQDTTSYTYGDT